MKRVVNRITVERKILNEYCLEDSKYPQVEAYRGCMYGHRPLESQRIVWCSDWYTDKKAKDKAEKWAKGWLESKKHWKKGNPFKIRTRSIEYV